VTINQYFQQLKNRFSRETGSIPALDLRLLIRAGASLSEEEFVAAGETPLSPQQIDIIEQFVARREKGEPVSRILGHREFWGLDFIVTKDTLDPRPDTEILVENALNWARTKGAGKALKMADIGTGTGCILIALLTELPDATGIAVDLSPEALAVARENAARHGVEGRISFRQGSYLEPLQGGEVDLLVSNPPYIPDSDIPTLAKEVRNHDPILALSGGKDGLVPYKTMFTEIKSVLNDGGRAFFEIGYGQFPDIVRLVDDSDATLTAAYPDLAGIPRVVEVALGITKK